MSTAGRNETKTTTILLHAGKNSQLAYYLKLQTVVAFAVDVGMLIFFGLLDPHMAAIHTTTHAGHSSHLV